MDDPGSFSSKSWESAPPPLLRKGSHLNEKPWTVTRRNCCEPKLAVKELFHVSHEKIMSDTRVCLSTTTSLSPDGFKQALLWEEAAVPWYGTQAQI